jgi:radical SAM superfamily enzyme YgiQ (UPF0313 family)
VDTSLQKLRNKNAYFYPGNIVNDIGPKELEGAKVTFINLPIREQAVPNNPPMGPALLAARLQGYGVEVNIIDLNSYRKKDALAESSNLPNGRVLTFDETKTLLADYFQKHGDQDLIGLSGLITTLKWQENVAKIIRGLQPQTIISSGGGLATEFREILFDWIPELDAFAHSEGDDVIIKMAHDALIIRKKGLKQAEQSGQLAPYFLGTFRGRPRFAYDGGRPQNLDLLPFPAWDLLVSDIYGDPILENYIKAPVWGTGAINSSATSFTMDRSLTMISSRGCPFACKFCFRGAQGERDYGIRSAQNVTDEMIYDYEKYNVDFIGVCDDNFMVSAKRIDELANVMKNTLQGSAIRWGTHGRLDEAADIGRPSPRNGRSSSKSNLRVDKMAEAGCRYIGFGAESASSTVLEEMGKGGSILKNGETEFNGYHFPTSMVEGIRNSLNAGIHSNCTWIMGYPGEKLEHLKTTIAFIKWQQEIYTEGFNPGSPEYQTNYDSVNRKLFVATAYPGTELFKHEVVREKLTQTFGINFDRRTGAPIPDESLRTYVNELDDASKVLVGDSGTLNYGEMEMDQFLEARKYIDSGEIEKILEM